MISSVISQNLKRSLNFDPECIALWSNLSCVWLYSSLSCSFWGNLYTVYTVWDFSPSAGSDLHVATYLIIPSHFTSFFWVHPRSCTCCLVAWVFCVAELMVFFPCLLLCLYVIMTQQRHGWIFLRFLEIVDLATNYKAIVDIRLCLGVHSHHPLPGW